MIDNAYTELMNALHYWNKTPDDIEAIVVRTSSVKYSELHPTIESLKIHLNFDYNTRSRQELFGFVYFHDGSWLERKTGVYESTEFMMTYDNVNGFSLYNTVDLEEEFIRGIRYIYNFKNFMSFLCEMNSIRENNRNTMIAVNLTADDLKSINRRN